MPKVPTYERQTKTAPLPSVTREARETPESQGAGVARAKAAFGGALSQLGGTVADAGVRAFNAEFEARQAREDQIIYQGSERALADLEFLSAYGDQGFTKAKGLEAQAAGERVLEHFREQGGMIVGMARNERQRAAIQRAVDARYATLREATGRWADTQLNEYDTNEKNAYLKTTLNAGVAAAHSLDIPRVTLELQRGEAAITSWAARHKEVGAAQRELQVQQFHTAMHVGVIEAFLEQQQDGLARTYYESAKEEIVDENQRTRVLGLLEAGSLRGVSQRVTDAIVAGGGTLAEQRAKVKAISDSSVPLPGDHDARGLDRARIREEVEQRFEQQHARAQRDEQEAHEQLVTRAKNLVDAADGNIDAVPVATMNALTLGEASALRNYADGLAKGTPPTTDEATDYFLTTLANSSVKREREQFLKTNLLEHINELSPARLQHYMDLQASMRKGDTEAAQKLLTNDAAQNAMVDEALRGMGFDPTPAVPGQAGYKKDVAERVGMFRRAVREARLRLEAEKGRPATDPEVQSIVDQMRTPAGQKKLGSGWFGGGYTDVYAFETAGAHVAHIQDVPPAERRQIERALRGRKYTDADIIELYNRRLAETRGDKPAARAR